MEPILQDMYDIMRCQAQYRAGYMEQFGLKSCHANYLLTLCAEPGISQEQLARRVYANKSNIARQLAVLEEAGYVRRESDGSDRRVMRVYPTEKAQSLLPLIEEKQAVWDACVTGFLSAEELEQARYLLEAMKHQAVAFWERER